MSEPIPGAAQAGPQISEKMVIYVLAALLLVSVAYIFAANVYPGQKAVNPALNTSGVAGQGAAVSGSSPASTTPASVPQEKIVELKGALEKYIQLQFGQAATLVYQGAVDEGSFVNLNFTDSSGAPIVVPVSKDGQYMFGNAMKITEFVAQVSVASTQPAASTGTQAAPPNVTKSDRPVVELFVMSYCPYGTQMEKALLPAQALLGDKADISIKFVSYTMHGAKETQENTRQYCMMQNAPDKFQSYLSCFLESGNTTSCMASTAINVSAISSCMNEAYTAFGLSDSGTSYPVHAAENQQYGVGGSPTLVINGAIVSASRSPEAVKAAICNAFTTAPAECSTTLSTAQASPGFGSGTSASTSSASCG